MKYARANMPKASNLGGIMVPVAAIPTVTKASTCKLASALMEPCTFPQVIFSSKMVTDFFGTFRGGS